MSMINWPKVFGRDTPKEDIDAAMNMAAQEQRRFEYENVRIKAELEQQRAMFHAYAHAQAHAAPAPAGGLNPFGSLIHKTMHVDPNGLVPPELPEDTTAAELFKELTEHHRYGKVMKRVLAEIAEAQAPRIYTEKEVAILDNIKRAMADKNAGSVINVPIPPGAELLWREPNDPVPF